jgi:hypothetical protein
MRYFPNIDRSAFRSGEYVGYASGNIYRIRRVLLARGVRGRRVTPHHIGRLTSDWLQCDHCGQSIESAYGEEPTK